MRWRRLVPIFVLLLAAHATRAETEIPKHVALARELVANVPPERNVYAHSGWVAFPTDALSGGYAARTDCSGLVYELLRRADNPTSMQMVSFKRHRPHPLAEDFVLSIEMERGFKRVDKIGDVQVGDIIAWSWQDFVDARKASSTGHVMLVNGAPKAIKPYKPIVAGLRQYTVSIIDSSQGRLGPDDTRILKDGRRIDGLGMGRLRIYANAEGEIVGFAKTFKEVKFHPVREGYASDVKPKKGYVGRPQADPRS